MAKPSLSTLQSLVAMAAGLTSIGGAAYSTMGYLRATPAPGELVAVVREAGTDRVVRGVVVQVRAPDDAIVTTMTQSDDGVARRAIPPGAYRVHVVHPAFTDAVETVRVQPGAVSELVVALEPRPPAVEQPARPEATRPDATSPAAASPRPRPAPPATVGRALDRGVTATRRFFGRLGL